jgi:hypothetical protein
MRTFISPTSSPHTTAALALRRFRHSLIYLTHVRRLVDRSGRKLPRSRRPGCGRWPGDARGRARLPGLRGRTGRLPQAMTSTARPSRRHSCNSRASRFVKGSSQPWRLRATRRLRYTGRCSRRPRGNTALRRACCRPYRQIGRRQCRLAYLSHALTLAHALRDQCMRLPQIVPSCGRVACADGTFVGRNKSTCGRPRHRT